MKAMKKTMKKTVALLLVVVMVFSISMVSYASDANYPIQVTVKFYNGATQLWTTQTISFNADIIKAYLPSGFTDPLNGAPSVYDAILKAVDTDHLNKPTVVGWDSVSIPQGAYISTVDTYDTINNYTYENGIHTSSGYGWIGYVDGAAPITYLSNVALQNGSVIEFKYDYYYYQW